MKRSVKIDGKTLETLARLAGEFTELPDDFLVAVGVDSDARQFYRKLRSLDLIEPTAKVELVILDRSEVSIAADSRISFLRNEYLKFFDLIDRVIEFHGERELFLRTGRYADEIASAVRSLPRLPPTDS